MNHSAILALNFVQTSYLRQKCYSMIKKAVIPAAGLGTRFLPATKAQPKEMLPIIDTPTIQYVVQEAVDSGIEDILIISGKGKRAIEDHFDRNFELETRLEEKEDELWYNEVRRLADMAHIHFIRQKRSMASATLFIMRGTIRAMNPSPCCWGIPLLIR